jgi:hypothetical protein
MMNMWLKKIISSWIVFGCFFVFSQKDRKLEFPEMRVWKSGPYIGVQRGLYWIGELGAEIQWKKIQLKSARSHGIHAGVNYNFTGNVLGYDLGYWIKQSRLGLTYGGNLLLRTDFTTNKYGFAPCLGYKILGFHLQTGYQLFLGSKPLNAVNTFFVSARFVLINRRDTKLKR